MPNIFEKQKVLRTLDIYLETMFVATVAPKTSQKKICNIVLFKAKLIFTKTQQSFVRNELLFRCFPDNSKKNQS